MIKSYPFLLLFLFFGLVSCATSINYYGASYDNSFNKSEINKIALVYSRVDSKNEGFWNHKTMQEVDTVEVFNNMLANLEDLMKDEGVLLINNSVNSYSEAGSQIYDEAMSIRVYRRDLRTVGNLNFSYQTKVDYSSQIEDLETKYALFLYVYPNQFNESVMVSNGFGGYSNSSSTHYRISLFSYLVDVEQNKVIWVFDNNEKVDLYTFDFNTVSKVIVNSMLKGMDTDFTNEGRTLK